jgi:hypothetical protein
MGDHVAVALTGREETLRGTLQNVVFHQDGTIAAIVIGVDQATYVPWHSVVALAKDSESDLEARLFD